MYRWSAACAANRISTAVAMKATSTQSNPCATTARAVPAAGVCSAFSAAIPSIATPTATAEYTPTKSATSATNHNPKTLSANNAKGVATTTAMVCPPNTCRGLVAELRAR